MWYSFPKKKEKKIFPRTITLECECKYVIKERENCDLLADAQSLKNKKKQIMPI